MAKLCKILFISAPVGAGHIRAAQAVSSSLCKKKTDMETKIVNVFDFFSPMIGKCILKIYFKILKLIPQLYGMAYSWGNESYIALLGRKIISGYLSEKMEKYIIEYNPAVIVCTHATPAGLVAYLVKKKKINIPVIAVVTDFVIHRLWIYSEIKHYVVANQAMRDFLVTYGIHHSCIKVMGIPIDEKFLQKIDKEKILTELEFNSKIKTILIIGGGAGILPMDEIVISCEAIDMTLQLVVVTGNNTNMYNKLMALQPKLHNRVRILRYVDNINELMAVSDLIISKPGGMTTAEALTTGVPMLIYKPIPGQEEANTNYLLQCKAALRADSLEDIQSMIKMLFIEHPEQLTILKENAVGISQPMAADKIAEYAISQMKNE